jgi:hypothetical protein
MKISSVVLTHAYPKLTKDTVNSIREFTGDRVMTLVDAAGWDQFQNFPNAEKGFYHAHKRSPYRNYALGLKRLYERWPDSDWYLYTEYDCVFVSDKFKEELKSAEERNAWLVGVDLRRFTFEFPELFNIINLPIPKFSYYFLGCCHFHRGSFVRKLAEINFFDKFLEATKDYEKGKFPGYNRWAFEEELWPTLATSLGGNLYELSCWKYGDQSDHQSTRTDSKVYYAGKDHDTWRGKFRKYPIRNAPDIASGEIYPEASIVHPLKDPASLVRTELAVRRKHNSKRKLFL